VLSVCCELRVEKLHAQHATRNPQQLLLPLMHQSNSAVVAIGYYGEVGHSDMINPTLGLECRGTIGTYFCESLKNVVIISAIVIFSLSPTPIACFNSPSSRAICV